MPSITFLLNLAHQCFSNGWLQVIVAILLLPKLITAVDSAHRKLISSGKQWRETGLAVINLAKRAENSVNRMMGYREDRPPRPVIDATLLAGDVLLYWMFAAYWFAWASLLLLLIVVKHPHELKLIVLSTGCTMAFYVIAAIYRTMGAKKFSALTDLFKTRVEDRRRMAAGITACMLVIVAAIYFAWPYIHTA